MSNLELLDRAAGNTACQMLGELGRNLVGAAVWPLWPAPYRFGALGLGALSLLAANYGCPPIQVDNNTNTPQSDGCLEVEGTGTVWYKILGTVDPQVYKYHSRIYDNWTKITSTDVIVSDGKSCVQVKGETNNGVEVITDCGFNNQAINEAYRFWLVPNEGSSCKRTTDDPHELPPDFDKPYPYFDIQTECTYNVQIVGFVQFSQWGPTKPVFRISAGGEGSGRASGGVIGGCNFQPVIYVEGNDGTGGGEPPIIIPEPNPLPPPPPDGRPWWLEPLLTILGGTVINQIINQLRESFPPVEPAGSFTLGAPCDFDEEGNHLERTWVFEQSSAMQRLHSHQVAMMEMLQQHLNWKTPTCGNDTPEKPPLEGDWVTTRWQSDEKMDHSDRRLRKLFRYRSKSSRDLVQLSGYWESFSWRAGPVCVRHTGAWWGDPQVWAESAEEGKRVIRHAAAEAGIDPDQVGRWAVSGSRSPRYGMSGTMRIHVHKGFPWVSSRDGASWPNYLAKEA